MADTKLSALTAKTTAADADLFYLVDSATSPITSKGITYANLEARLRDATIITDLSTVTAAAGDYLLVLDVSASPQALKKVLVSDLLDNATHTGDVTGSTALTIQPEAISGKGAVTASGSDYVLILDTSTSPHSLKKALVSDLGSAFGVSDITGAGAFTVAGGDLLVGVDISASPQVLGQATAQAVANLKVTELSEDTTPVLSGDLAAGGNNVTDLGDVTFKTGAAGGTLRTGTSNADKFTLQAYDVDGASYVTLIEADAGNNVRLQIPTGPLDFEDSTDNTKIMNLDLSGISTGTARTITMPDSDVNLGDIATNNAKVTNATHTGDATGSGALTLQPVAISGKGGITVASADEVLVVDASASPQVLGKTTAGAIADLFSLSVSDITGQAADSPMAAGTGDLLLAVDVSTSPWRLVQVTADSVAALGGGGGDAWSDPVNSDIVPTGNDSTYDLGTTTDRFAQTYTDTIWITDGDVTTSVADGASAVAFDLNNTATLSTSGAKLASFKNNGTEQFFIGIGGNVSIGQSNTVSNTSTVGSLAVGSSNTVDDRGCIAVGSSNNVGNDYTSLFGFGNTLGVSVYRSLAAGNAINLSSGSDQAAFGKSHTGGASFALTAGEEANTSLTSSFNFGAGAFSAAGDAQIIMATARIATADATQTTLLADASDNLTIPADTTWAFSALVVGRSDEADGNDSAAYKLEGCLTRDESNNTALVGSVTKTVIAESAGATAWDATAEADDTNEALAIKVTGEAATTIRWVAKVDIAQVTLA